jgi:hypothetical protein
MATYSFGSRGFDRVPTGGALTVWQPQPAARMAGADPGFLSWLKGKFGGLGGGAAKGAGALGLGGALGAAAIGAPVLLETLGQISREDNPGDPQGNLARNAGGAAGAIGGGALGAIGGGLLLGPIGAGLGAWAGSSLLGGAGRATAGSVFDMSRGTPEDRATRQAIRSNEAMARSQLGLQQEAFPIQMQQAQAMQQMEMERYNAQVLARARDTYQQALLGAASPVPGAYADPGFMQALAMAGRIG